MTSGPLTGLGAKFKRNTVEMGNVVKISAPSLKRDVVDTTVLGSASKTRTFISGLRDSGEVTLSLNFLRANYDLLKIDFDSDVIQPYSIELPDSTTTVFAFNGFITDLPLDIPQDDKMVVDVTIKISGVITVT